MGGHTSLASRYPSGIVWVLGAGFSKPLGGPLLRDLFGVRALETIRVAFNRQQFPQLHSRAIRETLALYQWGRDPDGAKWWTHAEEYLDVLDAARTGSPAVRNRLEGVVAGWPVPRNEMGESPSSVSELWDAARRLMAAETCIFLEAAQLGQERWDAHSRWIRELVQPRDTIVSFNFDRVLELLVAANDRFHIVESLGKHEVDNSATTRIFKLHGSVDWRRIEDGDGRVRYKRTDDATFALKCPDDQIALGTPGPSKRAFTHDAGELWECAESALQKARSVVFLGYRFPPTDAESKQRLLGAITANQEKYLAVHVVLGPDSKGGNRLRHLLVNALRSNRVQIDAGSTPPEDKRSFAVVVHELYAEDFMSVVPFGSIAQPWQPPVAH